jgi:hypothetical protein
MSCFGGSDEAARVAVRRCCCQIRTGDPASGGRLTSRSREPSGDLSGSMGFSVCLWRPAESCGSSHETSHDEHALGPRLTRCPAAIDRHDLAGDEGGGGAEQVRDHAADVLGCTQAADGCAGDESLAVRQQCTRTTASAPKWPTSWPLSTDSTDRPGQTQPDGPGAGRGVVVCAGGVTFSGAEAVAFEVRPVAMIW